MGNKIIYSSEERTGIGLQPEYIVFIYRSLLFLFLIIAFP